MLRFTGLLLGAFCVGLFVLPEAGGCRRSVPNPVTGAAVKPASIASSKPAEEPPAASAEESTLKPEEAAAESSSLAPVANVDAAPAEGPVSKERILVIAPGNPIIVELQLRIDGRPHAEALEKLVDEVLALADTDGDGRPTWKELIASKRVKYGQYGNLAIDNE